MTFEPDPPTRLPQPRLSRRREWASEQAISYLMQQAVENPDVISLAAGLVDPSTLPVEETRTTLAALLADDNRARALLQYGTTAGSEGLRQQLLAHFARLEGCTEDELGIDADRFILTTGSQQFLSLVGETLMDPGDICLVAAPTYFVFLGVLSGLGARAVPVETDVDGMRPDALEQTFDELQARGELDRVKLVYLVSYYENPSGYSIARERRPEIVRICRDRSRHHRVFILEDTAYRELRYDGPALPSVWSFDRQHDTVILTQTFSKSFSPGLRVGFGIAPPELVTAVCDRKGNEDFGSANFNQHLMAGVLQQGLFEPHVDMVRSSYRMKRDAMLAVADRYFAGIEGVEWVRPHGGLYVWMTLPEAVETGFNSPLFEQAVKSEGVMYVPGELCYAGDVSVRPRNRLRLSFGVEDPGNIDRGMKRLARAVNAVLRG